MRRAAALLWCLALAGCGFHLRRAHEFALPPSLAVLKVRMPAAGLKYPGLVLVVRHALEERGVQVVTRGQVPVLVLGSEVLNPVIVTVNNNGGASGYLLDYAVTFSLMAANGQVLMPSHTVRAQREYSFNPQNLLAMGREQSYLEHRLRRAAARQIVARLVAYRPPARSHPPAKASVALPPVHAP